MIKIRSIRGFRFFFGILKGSYLYILYIVIAASYWGVDNNLRPYIIQNIIRIFEISPRAEIFLNTKFYIYLFILSMLLRFVILRTSTYLRVYFNPYLKTKIMNYFINDIMLYIDIIDNENVNNLSNKIQEIVKRISSLVNLMFVNSVANIISISCSLYRFYQISIYIFLVLFGLIFLFFSISALAYWKGVKLSSEENESEMEIFSQYNDILNNIFHLKILGNYTHETCRLNNYYVYYKKKAQNRLFFDFFIICLLSFLFICYHIVSLILLVYLYQSNYIDAASFSAILLMNSNVPECLWNLVDDIATLSENIGVIEELLETLEIERPLYIESKINREVNFDGYDIEFKDVIFGYKKNHKLFDNLSFNITTNSKVGIVGYSGSGKSTIINLLLKLCTPDSGIIKVAGYDIDNLSHIQINSLITVMTQDLSLFNRTIKDNIKYSKLTATDEEIRKVARLANIDEFIENLPEKYDTLLQNNGKELSFGQRQRILIARAFLKNSPILILDEVTASLDNKSEKVIMDSLYELMKGKTVIVIAHKLYTLRNMDYLIILDNGKLIAKGKHSELLETSVYYKELYSQFKNSVD